MWDRCTTSLHNPRSSTLGDYVLLMVPSTGCKFLAR